MQQTSDKCARPHPNQKPGKCVDKECDSMCKQKYKGKETYGMCTGRCMCSFRCPFL